MSFTNEIENFNASLEVTELLMKTLENAAKRLAARCISEVATRHGFDAEKEIQALGLENLSVIRKQMAKKSGATKERKPREPKKSVFPMPFFAENVNADGCQGLAYNRGLFTQCPKNCSETGDYCKGCQTEADKNASGCPDCGNVSSRLATGLYEFKDPKGRSPISYLKLLKKLNITLEQVSEETGKQGKTIPLEHLVVAEKKKTSASNRGRPKKVNKVESDDMSVVSDLFSKLSVDKDKEVLEEVVEEVVEEEVEEEVVEESVKTKKPKLSDDEKAEKKAALEKEKAEKEAKKLALEAEKAEKKAALEAEKEAKKLALEAEKAEKKAALEKEKAEKKAALEAEKEAKKLAEKADRKAKRDAEKSEKKDNKKDETKDETKDDKKDEEPAPKNTVKVTRIQISGKSYLKTTNNLLFDPATKEEVGIWDPETKTIKPLPQEEEEEEQEEEYDNDSDSN